MIFVTFHNENELPVYSNDYAAVEYIFVLTVLPCRKIIYIIFDFFA